MTWPFNPEPAHGELPPLPHGVPRPAALDVDYGRPLGICQRESTTDESLPATSHNNVFIREWTKASVRLDCDTFTAKIVMKESSLLSDVENIFSNSGEEDDDAARMDIR
mmetsp:Transcript_19897/g.28001  ORF Transcript_19897/g.28001 Transcript_19897/m.28001 type:complete len:109 (-) Transcript_19897:314-640(-)